jgi:hypothetical protein
MKSIVSHQIDAGRTEGQRLWIMATVEKDWFDDIHRLGRVDRRALDHALAAEQARNNALEGSASVSWA